MRADAEPAEHARIAIGLRANLKLRARDEAMKRPLAIEHRRVLSLGLRGLLGRRRGFHDGRDGGRPTCASASAECEGEPGHKAEDHEEKPNKDGEVATHEARDLTRSERAIQGCVAAAPRATG